MSKRVKAWARKARVQLLQELGAFCHWPDCQVDARSRNGGVNARKAKKLTFDHIHGKDWEATGKSTDQRMLRYRKEAARGELQVLCAHHNELKGDPRGGLTWRQRWFEDCFLRRAYGEMVEA